MNIYITGSLAYDRIMSFPDKFSNHILPDKIHILNVCFLVDGLVERFGGTAGNIAYTLALLEGKSTILSQVGKDFTAYDKHLQGFGISVEGIRTLDQEFTAGAYITTDQSDNQITGFNPGAMKYPCLYDMTQINGSDSLGIVSPGNVGDMIDHPRFYRENKIPFIFDPGQQIPALTGEQLQEAFQGAEILITNDYELELIMNSTGMSKEALLDSVEYLVTTLGDKGAVINCKGDATHINAVPVETVADPTGVGDAFRAGLLKGLSMGKSVVDSCKMGATSATFVIETDGPQEHTFTMDEFTARYEAAFGPLE
ncbi:carbohydrate kinase family protein [Pseudodesulfovibrio sp. JC047]|uniref:carbohydrate kinase family protein n=1 Tax=Pseudodesulfovibrio sp. JC047 TaxID=2683199 RepID=UPI0013CFD5FB|nr:carbohydrate kinase family protein [Pseudodesulfovibrio sp. JC047]NDV20186.1 carbohydrate kinase family protein [Pseudodesulfovibrio sp. JC047]